eukprot:CAMPEP_0196656738 /NCGR_PEP_ID=MMETSP1086-20130531/19414_1 /TAXON_ID=77921 /ORGANISM="Cyanoptyche  gloeocystis , Strain SAG4.97" /LENGTH=59 /DNA_ID=CAMNT_0041989595 /DNA_START=113 /DNA_END=289 /DNA_ORIENTATION=-
MKKRHGAVGWHGRTHAHPSGSETRRVVRVLCGDGARAGDGWRLHWVQDAVFGAVHGLGD